MKCKKCGYELKDGVNFCPQCGEEVKTMCPNCGAYLGKDSTICPCCGVSVCNDRTASDLVSNTVSNSGNAQSSAEESKIKRKVKWWIIPIIVVILLICIPKGSKDPEVIFEHINIKDTGWGNLTVKLSAINLSNTAIKNIGIMFMAWDENGLPVLIPDNPIYYENGYLYEANYSAVNIPSNKVGDISFDIWCDIEDIRYVMPVVVSYEDYNGKIWKNPEEKSTKKLAGAQMKNVEGIYEME